MSLKYAILGFISSEPISGYDLSLEFGDGAGRFWYAKHSQIYPTLRKLEKENLVKKTTVTKGKVLKKNLYEITDRGIEELKRWATEAPEPSTQKDGESLKLMYMDLCSKEDIFSYLDVHQRLYEEQLSSWEQRHAEIETRQYSRLAKRISNFPELSPDLIVLLKELAVEHQMELTKADLEWIKRSREKLEKYFSNSSR